MTQPILCVKDLYVNFTVEAGLIPAVAGISFTLNAGEILGLVGESGCGKSVTALSLLRLIPSSGKITSGSILWQGADLLKLPLPELIKLRGREISIIFQEPLTSFNPVQSIGNQLAQAFLIHDLAAKETVKTKVIEGLKRVGFANPERQYHAYPHELSGGMRQRAMIAMALSCGPKLLIADEPTTALDVTIQAQILELLKELQQESAMSVLLITHNLGIVAEFVQRVAIMYAGRIVEIAPVIELFDHPCHPYTVGLLNSVPKLDQHEPLIAIPGMIPDPLNLPPGCYFEPRCKKAMKICREQYPTQFQKSTEHLVECWLYA